MAFDATKPQASEAKSLFPAQAQANWAALEDWLNDIGNFPTTAGTLKASKGASMALLSSQSASASATIDFSSLFTASYDVYAVTFQDVIAATDGVNFIFRVSQAAAFLAGASDYKFGSVYYRDDAVISGNASTGATGITLFVTFAGNVASTDGINGTLYIFNPLGTASRKGITWDLSCNGSDDIYRGVSGGGSLVLNTTAIDGIRFLMSSGNITSGKFRLYGLQVS